MIKKNLFKTLKVFTVAAVVALGIAVGAGKGTTPVLAAQNYITDSTSYHLNLDTDDVWRVYDANGNAASDYDGLVCNEFGWWKCANGSVDFSFNGLAENQYGWWNLVDGRVDFTSNDIVNNEFGWWKVTNGAVDFGFTGLAANQFGWWNLVDGRVDFTSNDIVNNEFGWWKVTNGVVDFGFTGLAANQFGWWNLVDGRVDFTSNDIVNNEFGWWKVTNGAVDFGFTGEYAENGSTYVIVNGRVENTIDTTDGKDNTKPDNQPTQEETETDTTKPEEKADADEYVVETPGKVELVDGTWMYVKNGKFDDTFTGVATNEFGSWYVENGLVRLDYSCGIQRKYDGDTDTCIEVGHTITYDGVEYRVENGRAIRQGRRAIIWHDLDGEILKHSVRVGVDKDGVGIYKDQDCIDMITVDVDENGNMIGDRLVTGMDTDYTSRIDDGSRWTTLRIGSPDGKEWQLPGSGIPSNFNLKDYDEAREVHLYIVDVKLEDRLIR